MKMNVLVDCPQSRAAEWSFRVLGVPVHVKFWFWVGVVLLCGAQETGAVLIWVAVCLASIVIHELGHVFAFRSFGVDAEVVLYGWGGLAVPRHDVYGAVPRLAVALAGPAAGFGVAALALAAGWLTGGSPIFGWHLFFPVVGVLPKDLTANAYWLVLVNDLLFVNFYWGLVNLLPVYPLDGWHAARAILEQRDLYGGRRQALLVSVAVGGLVAVLGLIARNLYLGLGFLVLALSSAQALEGERRRPSPPPYQHRRG
jgi:stage IV sporulation protein FB